MGDPKNIAYDNDSHAWLTAVAVAAGLPSYGQPERLGQAVREQAAHYNQRGARGSESSANHRDSMAARLAFWLPRDLPKYELAIGEVLDAGRLVKPTEQANTWRVLDLGCGLGAGHRGIARAMATRNMAGVLHVDAVDQDPKALKLLRTLTSQRPREGEVELQLSAHHEDLAGLTGSGTASSSWVDRWSRRHPGRYDVVILGQVLCELGVGAEPAERLNAQAELLTSLLRELVAPDGVLLVVEPALRTDARHLQQLRARVLAEGNTVVAPCLHGGECPLLGRETDWCHEDRPVDLPSWLVPVARLAGLRWEGLTFSFLAISTAGPTLADTLRAGLGPGPRSLIRAVSAPRVIKGKTELSACGDHQGTIGLLDRERRPQNRALVQACRGDVLRLPDTLDEKHRIDSNGQVTIIRRA